MLATTILTAFALAAFAEDAGCNFMNVPLEASMFVNGCPGDDKQVCRNFETEDEWSARMGVDATIETSGNLTLDFDVRTTGIDDTTRATLTRVEIECFKLDVVQEQTCTDCFEEMRGRVSFDPHSLTDLCPHAVVNSTIGVAVQLHAIVSLGFVDSDGEFFEMVQTRFCILIQLDVEFTAILDVAVEEAHNESDLGVKIEATEVTSVAALPCNLSAPSPADHVYPLNERICIHVEATGRHAANYYAWTVAAAVANNDTTYELFAGRNYGTDSLATADSFQPGAWTPATPDDLVSSEGLVDDFFTFWSPAKLLNGKDKGNATITATVAFMPKNDARKLVGDAPILHTITRRLDEVFEQTGSLSAIISRSFVNDEPGDDECRITLPVATLTILEVFQRVLASILGGAVSSIAIDANQVVASDLGEGAALICKQTFEDETDNDIMSLRMRSFGGTDLDLVQECVDLVRNGTVVVTTKHDDVQNAKKSTSRDSTLSYVLIGALLVGLVVSLGCLVYRCASARKRPRWANKDQTKIGIMFERKPFAACDAAV